jgi:hypothetical protein
MHNPPAFDRQREEERLNRIFWQIDSDNEGTRRNAAAALRDWMEKHRVRVHGLQVRLTLTGTDAERTLNAITDLERRNAQLQAELASLREFVGKAGLRQVEQLQKASAGGHLNEFLQAVKGMYRPQPPSVPRGASKAVATILGCRRPQPASSCGASGRLRPRRSTRSEAPRRYRCLASPSGASVQKHPRRRQVR